MLDNKVLQAVMPLAERLDATGVFLVPREGTPLYEMVRASNIADTRFAVTAGPAATAENERLVAATPVEQPEQLVFQPAVEDMVVAANERVDYLDASKHDVVTDHIADHAIAAVADHLKQARDVVAPIVRDLAERVMANMNDLAPSSILGMEIKEFNLPLPMQNGTFGTILDRYIPEAMLQPSMISFMPAAEEEQIIDWMMTGNASLDADIRSWVSMLPGGFASKVWETAFHVAQGPDAVNVEFSEFSRDVDNVVAMFLLSVHLIDNVVEGTEVSLTKYTEALADIRNACAFVLAYESDSYARNGENNLLVLSSPKKSIVTVHAEVYNRFLEQGGEIDVLYGNTLATVPSYTLAELATRAEELKSAWHRHCGLVQAKEDASRLIRVREFLEYAFDAQLLELSDEDRAAIGDLDTLRHRFTQAVYDVREEELECLYTLALKLICQVRFPTSAAFFILSEINKQGKKNPNLSSRECAAIATIKYVNTYIAAQFTTAS